jgi:hypothetical protein
MFRYTEQELRDFILYQAKHYDERQLEFVGEPLEVAYSQGSADAYWFVLQFMNEYKLEEVTNG